MTPIVFVHGWGFDARLWDSVRSKLADFDCDCVDLGFSGKPKGAHTDGERQTVAVGHSLGLLWLLHERPFRWRALVSVSGIPRFTKAPGYRQGVDSRVLDATIARFAGKPMATVRDFLHYCGCDAAPANIDPARLGEGLRWLRDWDARAALAAEPGPVLALYSMDDAVVPKALSEGIFAARPNTRLAAAPDGGHALPLTRPDWCASQIREFVRCL